MFQFNSYLIGLRDNPGNLVKCLLNCNWVKIIVYGCLGALFSLSLSLKTGPHLVLFILPSPALVQVNVTHREDTQKMLVKRQAGEHWVQCLAWRLLCHQRQLQTVHTECRSEENSYVVPGTNIQYLFLENLRVRKRVRVTESQESVYLLVYFIS